MCWWRGIGDGSRLSILILRLCFVWGWFTFDLYLWDYRLQGFILEDRWDHSLRLLRLRGSGNFRGVSPLVQGWQAIVVVGPVNVTTRSMWTVHGHRSDARNKGIDIVLEFSSWCGGSGSSDVGR